MLDSSLIKFVEPIGPGQIVDREALVALPVGYLKVAITNSETQINVQILGIRELTATYSEEETLTDSQVKAYVWQNGRVIAGQEIEDVETKAKRTNSYRRRSLKWNSTRSHRRACNFVFEKDPRSFQQDDSMVDAILQLCLCKTIKGVRGKSYLGSVHVALKYLTANPQRKVMEFANRTEDWYKVFQKCAFLPGNPCDIAKTNCYISGTNSMENNIIVDLAETEENPEETKSISSINSNPESVVSFSQFQLRWNKSRRLSRMLSVISRNDHNIVKEQKESNNNMPVLRRCATKWLKRLHLLKDVPAARYQRTSETASKPRSSVTPLVIVGTKNSTLSKSKKYHTIVSSERSFSLTSSNNSSIDIGYESSHCDWSDDDGPHSTETYTLEDKNNDRFIKKKSETKSVRVGASSVARPIKRSLERSVRVADSPSFTALREIGQSM